MENFKLGQMVMTAGVSNEVSNNLQFKKEVTIALARYERCDWGCTSADSVETNNEAIKTGDDQIFAVYPTCKGNIWIITEWDHSVTTILFPSEY